MAGLKSSNNPVFRNAPTLKAGQGGGYPTVAQVQDIYSTPQRLTMDDIVVKTGLLLGIIVVTGAVSWTLDASTPVVLVALLGGLALGLVNIFKKQVSPPLVVAYAAFEGVFLGAISHAYEDAYGGITLEAAVITAAVFGTMLTLFATGKLRATPKFAKIVVSAFVGLFALSIINLLASGIGGGNGLGLRSGGGVSILFSLAFIVVGSLTFVLDFDRAQQMVNAGVDERESWRIAFGLVVALVWLYLEVLRLLSYFARR